MYEKRCSRGKNFEACMRDKVPEKAKDVQQQISGVTYSRMQKNDDLALVRPEQKGITARDRHLRRIG